MARHRRTETILELILPSIRTHRATCKTASQQRPFILGLTGLQGCGKSTLASDIVASLNSTQKLRAVEVSLDDFYKTYDDREELRRLHPENGLLKVRGQPGTHDTNLATSFFNPASKDGLYCTGSVIHVPVFDKSLFGGAGDRLPHTEWRRLNCEPAIDVLVFEGWCVGFQPLSHLEVEKKLQEAKLAELEATKTTLKPSEVGIELRFSTRTLSKHSLQNLDFVNEQLREYCDEFMGSQHFDFLVHLDTDDLINVYNWRIEQERGLRKAKGAGMTDDEVVEFIQGYMPAYELYLNELRNGFFKDSPVGANDEKVHLQIVMDARREILKIRRI